MIERFAENKIPGKVVRAVGIGLISVSAGVGCFDSKRFFASSSRIMPIATPTIDGGYYPTRQKEFHAPNQLNFESMLFEGPAQIQNRLNTVSTNLVKIPVPFPDGYPLIISDRTTKLADGRLAKSLGIRMIPDSTLYAPLTGLVQEITQPGEKVRIFELLPDGKSYKLGIVIGGRIDTSITSQAQKMVRLGEPIIRIEKPAEINSSDDQLLIIAESKVNSVVNPEFTRNSLLQDKGRYIAFARTDTSR